MLLPINKELPYISPSSYMAWENCNYYHYLRKLSGKPFPEEFQTEAAALGTVFDCCIKSFLCKQKSLTINRQALWENVRIVSELQHVIKEGVDLFKLYHSAPPAIEVAKSITGVDLQAADYCKYLGIPIFGYPDACIGKIPFDWKTIGYNSTYQRSPTPGYKFCYDLTNRCMWKGQHARYGEPLDKLNPSWGTQCLFYSWMFGNTTSPAGMIHQIIYQPSRILLAVYLGEISKERIEEVNTRIQEMWEQSLDGLIPDPIANAHTCIKYKQVCQAATYCHFYEDWVKNGNDDK